MKILLILALVFTSSCAVLEFNPNRMTVISKATWIHKNDTITRVHSIEEKREFLCFFYIPVGDTVQLRKVKTLSKHIYQVVEDNENNNL